jgi:hypothetical protein
MSRPSAFVVTYMVAPPRSTASRTMPTAPFSDTVTAVSVCSLKLLSPPFRSSARSSKEAPASWETYNAMCESLARGPRK